MLKTLKKIFISASLFHFFLVVFLFAVPSPVLAADECTSENYGFVGYADPEEVIEGDEVTINLSNLNINETYGVRIEPDGYAGGPGGFTPSECSGLSPNDNGDASCTFRHVSWRYLGRNHYINVTRNGNTLCWVNTYKLLRDEVADAPADANCTYHITNSNVVNPGEHRNQCKDISSTYKVKITNASQAGSGSTVLDGDFTLHLAEESATMNFTNGTSNEVDIGSVDINNAHYFYLTDPALGGSVICKSATFRVVETCQFPPDDTEAASFKICDQIADEDLKEQCRQCAVDETGGSEDNAGGVWTAVGCIDRDPQNIIAKLITIGLGMGGGVTLLMILAASFMLTTSQGDPKRTGEAKEMVTAAIIGLVFVIFSVAILQFIGFTILRIPGFGG